MAFAERLSHGHPRIERAVGILERHLDAAVIAATVGALQRQHVLAVEADASAAGFVKPHETARQGRLAAAGFADDAERLAARTSKLDVLERAQDGA